VTGLPVFKPEGLLELSEKLKAPEIRAEQTKNKAME
jgi:hypothetical protein